MKKDELLENAIEAINKWKEEKQAQGKKPVCISHFLCIDPKNPEKSPKTKYAIFGESEDVMGLLAYTNMLLDPNGGKESLVKNDVSRAKKILFAHKAPRRDGGKWSFEFFDEKKGLLPRSKPKTKKKK